MKEDLYVVEAGTTNYIVYAKNSNIAMSKVLARIDGLFQVNNLRVTEINANYFAKEIKLSRKVEKAKPCKPIVGEER